VKRLIFFVILVTVIIMLISNEVQDKRQVFFVRTCVCRCNTVSHTKIERSRDGRVCFKKDVAFTTVAVSQVLFTCFRVQTCGSSISQTEADPLLVVYMSFPPQIHNLAYFSRK